MSTDKLKESWDAYQDTFGEYRSHGQPQQVSRGDLTVVSIPLEMSKMPGEFRVTFHPDETIAGLWILKPGVPIP